jgi:hypothetical protein
MIGRQISHYRVLSELGSGGMGVVYLAEDTALNRKVALKFLKPDTLQSAEAEARLVREARSASALDHANVATIYEIGEWEGGRHDARHGLVHVARAGERRSDRSASGHLGRGRHGVRGAGRSRSFSQRPSGSDPPLDPV